jgi:hypothetical protein
VEDEDRCVAFPWNVFGLKGFHRDRSLEKPHDAPRLISTGLIDQVRDVERNVGIRPVDRAGDEKLLLIVPPPSGCESRKACSQRDNTAYMMMTMRSCLHKTRNCPFVLRFVRWDVTHDRVYDSLHRIHELSEQGGFSPSLTLNQ